MNQKGFAHPLFLFGVLFFIFLFGLYLNGKSLVQQNQASSVNLQSDEPSQAFIQLQEAISNDDKEKIEELTSKEFSQRMARNKLFAEDLINYHVIKSIRGDDVDYMLVLSQELKDKQGNITARAGTSVRVQKIDNKWKVIKETACDPTTGDCDKFEKSEAKYNGFLESSSVYVYIVVTSLIYFY